MKKGRDSLISDAAGYLLLSSYFPVDTVVIPRYCLHPNVNSGFDRSPMKTRQLMFSLVGIVGLVIAFEIGFHLQPPPCPAHNPDNRLITISASPSPDIGKCEVDFPVALLRYKRTVQWAWNDNKYWIS